MWTAQTTEPRVKTDSVKLAVVFVCFPGHQLEDGVQSDSPTWSGFDFGFPWLRFTDWCVCREGLRRSVLI